GDRGGHLAGLALPDADPPVAVTDDDHGAEREAPAALDDLGDPARPADDALDVAGPGVVVPAAAAVAAGTVPPAAGPAVTPAEAARPTGAAGATAPSCGWWWHLELQSGAACAIGQGLHSAVETEPTPGEHRGRD